MARLEQGILGGITGGIGNIVGASWKGIPYIRTKALSVANPRTAGQVTQRTKFAETVILAQNILAIIIKPLWDRFAVKKSGYNDFVGTNVQFMLPVATRDFSKLIMSKGKMAPTPIVSTGLTIDSTEANVFWADDSGSGFKLDTDTAFIVTWNEDLGSVTGFDTGILRSAAIAEVTMSVPVALGNTIHFWLMFRRADGTVVSNSSYFTSST